MQSETGDRMEIYMKKNWKRWLAAGIVLTLTAGLLGGCGRGTRATPENLFRDMGRNLAVTNSILSNQIIELDTTTGSTETKQTANMDVEMMLDSGEIHSTGQVRTVTGDSDVSMETEIYRIKEDDQYVMYYKLQNIWFKMSQETSSDAISGETLENLFSAMRMVSSSFEVSRELPSVNNKECFEMNGTLNLSAYQEYFGGIIGAISGNETGDLLGLTENKSAEDSEENNSDETSDVTDETQTDATTGDGAENGTSVSQGISIPCTIDVYRDSILPAKITIDLTEVLAQKGTGDTDTTKCSLTMTFLEYDSLKSIKLPKGAASAIDGGDTLSSFFGLPGSSNTGKDSEDSSAEDEEKDETETGIDDAEESGADVKDQTEVSDSQEKTEFAGKAEQSKKLGENWDSYTVQINDKVVTLPCTVSDLKAAGLEMDSTYTPEDYEIHPGEYQMTWFKDDDGNEIMADLLNSGEDDAQAKDCLIAGITVEKYAIKNDSLKVLFPGEVQIGDKLEKVSEIYGKPNDTSEGDLVNLYYWYTGESHYNGCEIDTDSSTGKITTMSLDHFEVEK